MNDDKDVTIHTLKSRIYELEADNAHYKKNLNLARKYEFRVTGALLLIIGTVISIIAYPSYSTSNVATVLVMVGIGAIFLGAVTMFVNTEKFINQNVAEHLSLSSVIVLDDLLRDLRVKNKGIYIPSSKTGSSTRIFIPLKRTYTVPTDSTLKDEKAFLIGLADPSQEGVLVKPLGYHLYKYTTEELHVDWSAQPDEESRTATLTDRLNDVFVKGLDLADHVTASTNDGTLRVRLVNTPYTSMCRSLLHDAPQVFEQIGGPLSSLIACIYTESANCEVMIDAVTYDKRDIDVVCKTVESERHA